MQLSRHGGSWTHQLGASERLVGPWALPCDSVCKGALHFQAGRFRLGLHGGLFGDTVQLGRHGGPGHINWALPRDLGALGHFRVTRSARGPLHFQAGRFPTRSARGAFLALPCNSVGTVVLDTSTGRFRETWGPLGRFRVTRSARGPYTFRLGASDSVCTGAFLAPTVQLGRHGGPGHINWALPRDLGALGRFRVSRSARVPYTFRLGASDSVARSARGPYTFRLGASDSVCTGGLFGATVQLGRHGGPRHINWPLPRDSGALGRFRVTRSARRPYTFRLVASDSVCTGAFFGATVQLGRHGGPWTLSVLPALTDVPGCATSVPPTSCRDNSRKAMLPTITNSSARVRRRLKRVRNFTPGSRDRPCYHPAVTKQMMKSASNNCCL